MSLPYLPGWGDTLAQNLPSLGNSIAHIVNPNLDQQKLFQDAIAKNPELLQAIANNPGLAQSLQNSGFSKDIAKQTAGMQVDPSVAAQRNILTSKANVAKGTEQSDITTAQNQANITGSQATSAASKARVDTATEADVITQNAAQTKLLQTQAADADQKHKLAQAALAKYPTLAGIDINKLANDVAAGRPLDAELAARIAQEPGAENALVEGIKSSLNRQDIASRFSIADLKKKDPDYKVAALNGMDRALKDINDRIVSANGTIKAIQAKNPLLLQVQAQSQDPNIAGPAQAELKQYQEAKAIVEDKSPNSLSGQWQQLITKRTQLLGDLGSGTDTQTSVKGGSSSIRVKLSPSDVNQYKAAFKSNRINRAALQAQVDAGKLSSSDFNAIVQ